MSRGEENDEMAGDAFLARLLFLQSAFSSQIQLIKMIWWDFAFWKRRKTFYGVSALSSRQSIGCFCWLTLALDGCKTAIKPPEVTRWGAGGIGKWVRHGWAAKAEPDPQDQQVNPFCAFFNFLRFGKLSIS